VVDSRSWISRHEARGIPVFGARCGPESFRDSEDVCNSRSHGPSLFGGPLVALLPADGRNARDDREQKSQYQGREYPEIGRGELS
jgi:hypothetical protein